MSGEAVIYRCEEDAPIKVFHRHQGLIRWHPTGRIEFAHRSRGFNADEPDLRGDIVPVDERTPDRLINQARLINKHLHGLQLFLLDVASGHYYPRVFRPCRAWPPRAEDRSIASRLRAPFFVEDSVDRQNYAESLAHLDSLLEHLQRVFRVVAPSPPNADAFGVEIRSGLLLACTEVESHLTAVLAANEYVRLGRDGRPQQWKTEDYVKLLAPMRLGEYEVEFPLAPRWPSMLPFADWTPDRPSASLNWYAAYNATKHNREEHDNEAKLAHFAAAVAGCAVLVHAQFGLRDEWTTVVRNVVRITRVPTWSPSEWYTPDYGVSPSSTKYLHTPTPLDLT